MLIDPELGKKNNEQEDVTTYGDITGFTRSNGDIPTTESICNAINEKVLSFNNVANNFDMSGYKILNFQQASLEMTLPQLGFCNTYLFINSIDPTSYPIGELLLINGAGDGLITIDPKTLKSEIENFLIL